MNVAVIGLGFGDEGKGLVTDYLTSKLMGKNEKNVLVVRFSGGQQAGHTVVRNGVSHVFSNFGSGTLAGAHTYWSKFCTVDPVGIVTEREVLSKKNVSPIIYIDAHCPVTTPYDKIDNQIKDRLNGTCGTGFGSTLQREQDFYSLKARDIKYQSVLMLKLEQIKNYYYAKNPDIVRLAEEHIADFLAACRIIKHGTIMSPIVDSIPEKYKHKIFEGSQGMLLDMKHGIFPHVTRSHTDTTNIREILGTEPFEIYLITRAYQTRHGNGPMTNDKIEMLPLINTETETNKLNTFQGNFRTAILDIDLLNYALEKDQQFTKDPYYVNLVITCLDQLQEFKCTLGGELCEFTNSEDFVNFVRTSLITKFNTTLINSSPASSTISINSILF